MTDLSAAEAAGALLANAVRAALDAGVCPSTIRAAVDAALPKQRRGFRAMDPDRQRAIAQAGGRAAQASGAAHRFSSEEASEAGRKGGLARRGAR